MKTEIILPPAEYRGGGEKEKKKKFKYAPGCFDPKKDMRPLGGETTKAGKYQKVSRFDWGYRKHV